MGIFASEIAGITTVTITQPAIQQVQRGNPKAIEALLRKQLRSKELRVQVVRKEKQLCIYFTGKSAPPKQELLPLVERALRHVGARDIDVARVRAYRNGVREAVWSGRILLKRSLRRSGLQRWLATGRGREISQKVGFAVTAGVGLLAVVAIGSLLRGSPESELVVGAEAGPGVTDAVNSGSEEAVAAEAVAAETAVPDDGLLRISGLPAHRLREQDVFDSKRVQLDAKDDISRDECRALAAHYLDAAGANGKVVVQKPNPQSPWNGKRAPYCANNLDGQGTFFNDEYFDDIP